MCCEIILIYQPEKIISARLIVGQRWERQKKALFHIEPFVVSLADRLPSGHIDKI
jgi:hypothetical protein